MCVKCAYTYFIDLKHTNKERRKMKTFTSINKFPKGSYGYEMSMERILIASADPKNPELYRIRGIDLGDKKGNKEFTVLRGKINQAAILSEIKTMIEVV